MYYLEDGTDRAFVLEELTHVSEDTQVPTDVMFVYITYVFEGEADAKFPLDDT